MIITSTADYVRWTQTTALYLEKVADEESGKEYELLGALDECGEIAGMLKRQVRDGIGFDREAFGLELGDLAWYLARIHYSHADAPLDSENNMYPIINQLKMIDKIKGMTCFEIAIAISEKLHKYYKSKEDCANFLFGGAPRNLNHMMEQLKMIQQGFENDDPVKHFVFSMSRRLTDCPTVGILMHIAAECHTMEAILDWTSLCYKFNYDVLDVLQNNVIKLESRKERGALQGKGSSR